MSVNVSLDTSPLETGHAIRGIGRYTSNLRDALQTNQNVHLVSDNPDIIHYPFFDLFQPTLPLWRSAPAVVTIHDVIPLQFRDNYPVGIRGKSALLRQKLALKTVAAIITDSQASQQAINYYLGVPLEKINVVYLAAQSEFKPVATKEVAQAQKKYQVPKEYILYVGDINYNKNIPELIRTLTALPKSTHLVCVGKNFKPQDIPEWQAIQQTITLTKIEKRIHFVTNLPKGANQDLAALYTGAAAYVQPSLAEGFGLPVLEALQCGTPVVASNTTSLPEVGGEVAFYAAPNHQAFATALQPLLSWTNSDRKKYAKKAQNWAATFSWQKTATKTLEVYKRW